MYVCVYVVYFIRSKRMSPRESRKLIFDSVFGELVTRKISHTNTLTHTYVKAVQATTWKYSSTRQWFLCAMWAKFVTKLPQVCMFYVAQTCSCVCVYRSSGSMYWQNCRQSFLINFIIFKELMTDKNKCESDNTYNKKKYT